MLRAVLALVLGLGVTAGAYFGAQSLEEGIQLRIFEEQVQRTGLVAMERMAAVTHPIETFGLYAERREINFGTFVPELKSRADSSETLRAMAWLPVVKDRPLFEEQVGRYYQGYEIREQTPEGDVKTAGPASAWVPVLLIEPGHTNDVLRGLDIGNQAVLAQTMQQTYMRHAPVVSPLFQFTGIDEPLMVALFYVPEPEGFAAALIEPDTLVDQVLLGRPEGLVARLVEEQTRSVLVEEPGFVEEDAERFAVSMGGRTFSLDLARGPAYQPTQLNLALAAGFAGAGVTVLMLALALVGGGKKESA
jgi:hypothetical protein